MRQAQDAWRAGQALSAEGICTFVLEQERTHAGALALLAEICFTQGRAEEALAHLDARLAADAGDVAALVNRGSVLDALGRRAEAFAAYERAIALDGRDVAAHFNRANLLQALERHGEALAGYDAALALQPAHADAWINRAHALRALGRFEAALQSCERALAIAPRRADAHYNHGNVLRALERDREALAAYERAIELQPAHVDAHWNRAWALLALGDCARGWPEFEWRWKTAEAAQEPQRFAQPQWRGEPEVAGKSLLVHTEQGIGDSIHFARYLPLAAARFSRVVCEVQPSLRRLFAQFAAHAHIVSVGEAPPACDLRCPLLSLPLAFGTALDSIPAAPYLQADAALAQDWAQREPRLRAPGLKVGLVWAGNARQKSEPRRGIGLAPCAPLFDIRGVRWFSLQVGERAADLRGQAPDSMIDLSPGLEDFADTAAVMSQLDLVISTDTAAAHLAGALGRPVWMLLMHAPDWRWLRGRDDSPWYPSARLFRQARPGDWDGVIARVGAALARRADTAGG